MIELKHKEKQTHVIIAEQPPHLSQRCTSVCRPESGASARLLWATGLCDHISGRGFCHHRTRWDRFTPEFLSRASKVPLCVLDWRDQYREALSAVFANQCSAVSPGGQALGSQGVLYPGPLSKSHPLC